MTFAAARPGATVLLTGALTAHQPNNRHARCTIYSSRPHSLGLPDARQAGPWNPVRRNARRSAGDRASGMWSPACVAPLRQASPGVPAVFSIGSSSSQRPFRAWPASARFSLSIRDRIRPIVPARPERARREMGSGQGGVAFWARRRAYSNSVRSFGRPHPHVLRDKRRHSGPTTFPHWHVRSRGPRESGKDNRLFLCMLAFDHGQPTSFAHFSARLFVRRFRSRSGQKLLASRDSRRQRHAPRRGAGPQGQPALRHAQRARSRRRPRRAACPDGRRKTSRRFSRSWCRFWAVARTACGRSRSARSSACRRRSFRASSRKG